MEIKDLKAGKIYYMNLNEFIIVKSINGDNIDYTHVYLGFSTDNPNIRDNAYVDKYFKEKYIPALHSLNEFELVQGERKIIKLLLGRV